jgi:hypothetical protein
MNICFASAFPYETGLMGHSYFQGYMTAELYKDSSTHFKCNYKCSEVI